MISEIDNYINRLDDLHNQVSSLIAELPAEALNWRPIEDQDDHITNSLAVLTAHLAGVEHFWIAEVIGGQAATRDRDAEFVTVAATPAELLQILEKVSLETKEVLSALSESDLGETRQAKDRTVAVRWGILHVIDHTSLHLGHMQITYQLWTGGKNVHSPLWTERLPQENIAQTNVGIDDLKNIKYRYLQVGRFDKMNAITCIRATLLKSAREFFDQDGWLEISPIPAISSLSGACEDFSTLFSVDYFGKRAFLIQTGQQHLEPFIYGPMTKVYAFNQSYRAETQFPERRLTSFLLIEAEAANYTLEDIQDVQERLIYKLCSDVFLWRKDDLKLLGADLSRLTNLKLPFERIRYTKAIEYLRELDPSIQMGKDLESEHEKALGKKMQQPFFVSHYPANIKFFNMKSDSEDSTLVLSSDLLLPGYGEAIGSSQREDNYDKLLEKLKQFGEDETRSQDMQNIGINGVDELMEIYKWYLDLRKEHQVPHSGFGLGFERLVQWICGLDSIIEATEYPKTKAYLSP